MISHPPVELLQGGWASQLSEGPESLVHSRADSGRVATTPPRETRADHEHCVEARGLEPAQAGTSCRLCPQWTRPGVGREDTAAQALQPTPDVTTVAVEETAAMFPEREQHADRQPQMQPSEKSLTVSAESCQALKG